MKNKIDDNSDNSTESEYNILISKQETEEFYKNLIDFSQTMDFSQTGINRIDTSLFNTTYVDNNTNSFTRTFSRDDLYVYDDTNNTRSVFVQREFETHMPDLRTVNEMCELYPGFKKAFEHFKTMYNLTIEEYKIAKNSKGTS
jgi:hypothetical protein